MSPLVVENATKQFRQGDRVVDALAGVSLEVKSTLLHLMAGLAKPQSGKVIVNGSDISAMGDRELTLFRRRQIGLVFQAFNLIPTLSAEENILLPLMLDGKNGTTTQHKVDEILGSLNLDSRRNHRPDAMSGGEQQRVAIGRALITDPAVILADEPTGNLDSVSSKAVCDLLRDLSTMHGRTIVMVTHEPSVASYAQEVAVLKDGKLIERFPTDGPGAGQELALRYQEVLR
jgi:putative ABC transport system ATP-binding protein